jgi:hypothetical protein
LAQPGIDEGAVLFEQPLDAVGVPTGLFIGVEDENDVTIRLKGFFFESD